MTVSEYISNILKEYTKIKIDTNHVKDGSDKYGLFKSPRRDVKPFTDGSYEIKEYYEFLARQVSTSEKERMEADELLEDISYWIDDLPYTVGLPNLDKGRTVTNMELTGSPYPMEADDKSTMYHMTLSITYIREREDL